MEYVIIIALLYLASWVFITAENQDAPCPQDERYLIVSLYIFALPFCIAIALTQLYYWLEESL